ncbi:MAG: hypothetical protein Ta2D_01390 [Rickettsiales bacterium]|nr:MAG: hypothetical protein Ta2D_01390 [Rickettsiales bacterium]
MADISVRKEEKRKTEMLKALNSMFPNYNEEQKNNIFALSKDLGCMQDTPIFVQHIRGIKGKAELTKEEIEGLQNLANDKNINNMKDFYLEATKYVTPDELQVAYLMSLQARTFGENSKKLNVLKDRLNDFEVKEFAIDYKDVDTLAIFGATYNAMKNRAKFGLEKAKKANINPEVKLLAGYRNMYFSESIAQMGLIDKNELENEIASQIAAKRDGIVDDIQLPQQLIQLNEKTKLKLKINGREAEVDGIDVSKFGKNFLTEKGKKTILRVAKNAANFTSSAKNTPEDNEQFQILRVIRENPKELDNLSGGQLFKIVSRIQERDLAMLAVQDLDETVKVSIPYSSDTNATLNQNRANTQDTINVLLQEMSENGKQLKNVAFISDGSNVIAQRAAVADVLTFPEFRYKFNRDEIKCTGESVTEKTVSRETILAREAFGGEISDAIVGANENKFKKYAVRDIVRESGAGTADSVLTLASKEGLDKVYSNAKEDKKFDNLRKNVSEAKDNHKKNNDFVDINDLTTENITDLKYGKGISANEELKFTLKNKEGDEFEINTRFNQNGKVVELKQVVADLLKKVESGAELQAKLDEVFKTAIKNISNKTDLFDALNIEGKKRSDSASKQLTDELLKKLHITPKREDVSPTLTK